MMLQPILDVLNCQKIVLASASVRRKQILQNVGLKFDIVPSTFDETLDKAIYDAPGAYTMETAKQKAHQVEHLLSSTKSLLCPYLVIAADTVVTLDGDIFEKPKTKSHAASMLSALSGRSHVVTTGMFIIKMDTNLSGLSNRVSRMFYEETQVLMAKLTPDTIRAYVESGEPMDKAGGYGIQGIGGSFVESIIGDFYNVMGLPLCRLAKELVRMYNSQ